MDNPSRYIGSFVITAFGAFWLLSWSLARGASSTWVVPIALGAGMLGVASIVRFVRAGRGGAHGQNGPGRRTRLWFGIVVFIEAVVIYAATGMLARRGLAQWIAPGVILVVGLHFIPLARIFRYHAYAATGLALVLVALGLPWLLADGPRSPSLLLAAGIILWATAAHILCRTGSRPAV